MPDRFAGIDLRLNVRGTKSSLERVNGKRWVAALAVSAVLAFSQSSLTPYLTYQGRGVPRAVLSEKDAALLGPIVFLLVLAACVDASTLGKSATCWHCCFRSAIWSAVLSLFFLEIVSCCALRFQEVPASGSLHGHVVLIYFGLTWASSLSLMLFGAHLRAKISSRIS